jgi:plasmid stabilization system protein ParE
VARVVWTDEAISDIEAIRSFIARSSPHYGDVVAARLVEAVDRLIEFPGSGRVVPELGREDVREIIQGTYRIVYQVLDDSQPVEILTVFRVSRTFPQI